MFQINYNERGSERMKKKVFAKIAAFFISVCLLAGIIPESAAATNSLGTTGVSTGYSFNLNRSNGIDGIQEPSTVGEQPWDGSRIYFGSNNNKPVLWRVLDNDASVGGKSMMLLQTDQLFAEMAYDELYSDWESSDIRIYLNGSGKQQFLSSFSEQEKTLLVKSTKKAAENTVIEGITYTNPAIKEDRVFLLSAEEVLRSEYGYPSNSSRKMVSEGDAAVWWLRSGIIGDAQKGSVIDSDGKLGSLALIKEDKTVQKAGVAPCVYLDTSRILFTTPAGKKPDHFSAITEVTGKVDWTLTLTLNGDLHAKLSDNNQIFQPGDAVMIQHQMAASWRKEATQTSALLTDESGKPFYYGKVNNSSNTSSQIIVPEGLLPGNYKLYVFAEQINTGNGTDYASNLGNPVNITIKLTPQIIAAPGAVPITCGQLLSESALNGGLAKANGMEIPGTFTWKNGTIKPGVGDSMSTIYDVIFTPKDSSQYLTASVGITVQVNKIQYPPNMPSAVITVDYGISRVSQVSLPEGWFWSKEDAARELTAGTGTQATAIYQDTINYENCMVSVTINRSACSHKGGTVSCSKLAVCNICGQSYGALDSSKHGASEIRGVKQATCTEKGYTGDTYCKDCNQVLGKGQETAVLGHSYTFTVTKEATEEEEGIMTYTCSRCGNQYTEKLGKHSHYYNQTKTLKWVNCTQKGEVEHSCACGDSYIEVIPALGHDYQESVTVKATIDKAGVKTFTCKRCGTTYTETIPKLSNDSSNSGSSGGTHNNSGSSLDGVTTIGDRIPYVKGNSAVSGWSAIQKEIGKASEGDIINISMNNTLILPAKTLEALKGKKITLVLDLGDHIKWSFLGTEVTQESLKDINLKVTQDSNAIPKALVEQVAGEHTFRQISLAHNGEFGCTARIQLLLDAQKAGYYANLFYYNQEKETLDYRNSVQLNGKGIAEFELTHASEYLIILDTAVMDGSNSQEPQPETSVSTEEEQDTQVTNPIQEPTQKEKKDSGLALTILLILVFTVLGIGLLLFLLLRFRAKQKDTFLDSQDDDAEHLS